MAPITSQVFLAVKPANSTTLQRLGFRIKEKKWSRIVYTKSHIAVVGNEMKWQADAPKD